MTKARLQLRDGLRITGKIRLTARDPWTGRIVGVVESENLVVTAGKALLCQMLIDDAGYDTGITYCALGISATAPAITDTQLTSETSRLEIAANGSKSRAVNVITFSTFFLAAVCSIFIQEVGLFGHSTATAAANSGVLFAHGLLSYDNQAGNVDLTIDYVVSIS